MNVHRVLSKLEDVFVLYPKGIFQKVFSKYHVSKFEVWDARVTLAKRILPVLKAFREAPKSGYPGTFMEWEEAEAWPGSNKEDYRGGGIPAWEAELDKMIFAFEWLLYSDEMLEYTKNKKAREWLLKNGDPFATRDPKDRKEPILGLSKEDFYHDDELEKKLYDQAQEGLDSFRHFFLHLWD